MYIANSLRSKKKGRAAKGFKTQAIKLHFMSALRAMQAAYGNKTRSKHQNTGPQTTTTAATTTTTWLHNTTIMPYSINDFNTPPEQFILSIISSLKIRNLMQTTAIICIEDVQQLKYNLTEPEYDVSVRNMY
jgi:hypothetical protein